MTNQTGFASAVIVAGGTGSRMGRPKQMLPLGAEPVLFHTVRAFLATPEIAQVIVVTPPENQAALQQTFPGLEYALPGDTRLQSVINGVKKTDPGLSVVAVHDGARPLVKPGFISRCIQEAQTHGAAVLAVPVKDTIKECKNFTVCRTLNRQLLWAAQTPQCYQRALLIQVLEKYGQEKDATDESQLVEKLGICVRVVPSDYANNKLTTPEDLIFAEALMHNSFYYRTGFGFDLHRMAPGLKMFIGGVEIPHEKGFVGHSDGDLVLHAICDAVLGALCEGEIGILFPPTDPTIKGICSVDIAKKVLEIVRRRQAQIVHIDATLITQEPKIKPHYEEVRASLARIFDMDVKNVSFKSKSHEHVGEIGQGQAAMCQAVATLKIKE